MFYIKFIFLSYLFLFVSACSSTTAKINPTIALKDLNSAEKIKDLERFSQSSRAYLKKITLDDMDTSEDKFENRYFSPWNRVPSDTKKAAMWPFYSYRYGDMYGENLKLIDKTVFDKIKLNANFDNYKTINQKAITLKHLNLRAFPTSSPMFRDPSVAGEGFPFDYMQNSTISANKPILISHYSKDKEWAYIFTSFTGGWVSSKNIINIGKKYTDLWQKAKQIFLIKDDLPLYDADNNFLFNSRVGMMLPLVSEDKNSYTVLTISSYKNNQANYHKTKVSKDIAHKDIMSFNKYNIQNIFDEVSKSKYGWGGMYGQRDCSSTVRDIYTPFGVWFPRNSYQQSKVGETIKMEAMSDEQKIDLIKKRAIPFKTLLYKKGHVLIYVGTQDDEVIVFHNAWGIKTKYKEQEGRVIVGKSVYSTLNLGKELKYYDEEASLLKNLKSMNIIAN
jgi:hypothetical protein